MSARSPSCRRAAHRATPRASPVVNDPIGRDQDPGDPPPSAARTYQHWANHAPQPLLQWPWPCPLRPREVWAPLRPCRLPRRCALPLRRRRTARRLLQPRPGATDRSEAGGLAWPATPRAVDRLLQPLPRDRDQLWRRGRPPRRPNLERRPRGPRARRLVAAERGAGERQPWIGPRREPRAASPAPQQRGGRDGH